MGTSPTRIANPELRYEAAKAFVWAGVIGLFILAVYIAQPLLVLFGAMVFAALLDGGARLLGRVIPIGRQWRVALVLALAVAFFVWLGRYAGSQISQEAALLPEIVLAQAEYFVTWLQSQGVAIDQAQVQNLTGTIMSGVGTITKAIGGLFGGFATIILIIIIGIYVALEPMLYERGIAWMLPRHRRDDFYVTAERMGYTMRRLMAGRLVGMVFEGLFTYALLAWYGVPMAALLAILTGLLAFVPNLGAFISGIIMVLVGFSGGVEMGLYTVFVYFLVQSFDGYVIIPLIARKTVDLAPALVLAAQLIMGILFGVLGLFLADPLLAMLKVLLERRSEHGDAETQASKPAIERTQA